MSKSKISKSIFVGAFAVVCLPIFGGFDRAEVLAERIQDSEKKVTYACHSDDRKRPTTFALEPTDYKKGTATPVIYWEDTSFGSRWTPLERCKAVSSRLQKAYLEYGAVYISYTRKNGHYIVCALPTPSATPNSGCMQLFTLKTDEDIDKIASDFDLTIHGGNSDGITRTVPPSEGGRLFVNMNEVLKSGQKIRFGKLYK